MDAWADADLEFLRYVGYSTTILRVNLVNIESSSGLFTDGTKTLPWSILTHSEAFAWESYHNNC